MINRTSKQIVERLRHRHGSNIIRQSQEANMIKGSSKTAALAALIRTSSGRIFFAEFVKKDKTIRRMTARLGVTKYLTGGELGYDAASKGLLTVFDMDIRQYRTINLNTISMLSIDGIQLHTGLGVTT